MKVSIILPVRNEEDLIVDVVHKLYAHLNKKKYMFEILCILNGCNDNTEKKLFLYKRNKSNIKILKSKPGYGFALKKGLKCSRGKYVVIFNVDFYDLELINLVDIDLMGKDLIIGSKMTYWSTDRRPLSRRVISFIFNLYLRFLFGFKGSDTHGIKVFRGSILKDVFPKCKTTSGIFDTELVLRTHKLGYKVADVPVLIEEKRSPRFVNRVFRTPLDMWNLHKSFKNFRL